MSRRNWIIIGGVAIVLVIGFIIFRNISGGSGDAAQLGQFQTVEADLGSLVATVGATGEVRASQTATVFWKSTGTVDEVLVEVGDLVQEADLLATIRKETLSQGVILAQADLVSAEDALEDMYETFDEQGLAQASQALANAQKAVEDAERYYNNLSSPAPQVDIDQAKANLILAEDKLDDAQEDYAPYANKPDSTEKAAYLSAQAQAQKDYDNALRLYNNLRGIANDTDLAIAEADLEVAREQLLDAENEFERISSGPTTDDIAAAEARVDAARAALSSAFVDAPFEGTVTQSFPASGDIIGPSDVAFRIDDLSRLLVDVEISEIDINRVEIGQPVELSFDAILNKEYQGEVVEVSPVGVLQQGVVNFMATIELVDADEDVRPGMTAAVNIVVNQLNNVLVVPNRAVRVMEGERIVYIIDDTGELTTVPITLGASSEEVSEVVAGDLSIGDTIVLNPPAANFFAGGPPGGNGP
ncbi:MAG: efflux RND transporter periplasmic adaptor subunit [Chloroflexi bacterium]|nr:MAG: efflux RND transporter periplasmic adaptor subunit [Chloroflexota bacterium]MBL1196757.1 efflux RND transporter periplasmic adaptor subunit [Chloroflexota bacterium]NOH14051.1 efflux RND transporter periplasmic adaptor subunit [Chloroflexota bacterium]